MSHLEDRLAEFVFEELPSEEMTTARQHVAQCLECQGRVSDFQRIRHSLEQLPDIDLARRMVFVPESPSLKRSTRSWFSLAWALPGAVAAVLLVGVVMAGPLQVEWGDQGVRIAFGQETAEPEPVSVAAAVDYENLDYERIAARLETEQRVLIDAQLQQFSAEIARLIEVNDDANRLEIRRVRAGLDSLIDWNRAFEREVYVQGVALQGVVQQTAGLE